MLEEFVKVTEIHQQACQLLLIVLLWWEGSIRFYFFGCLRSAITFFYFWMFTKSDYKYIYLLLSVSFMSTFSWQKWVKWHLHFVIKSINKIRSNLMSDELFVKLCIENDEVTRYSWNSTCCQKLLLGLNL